VWVSPHSRLDRPVAFPEDGIRGQGKAVGTDRPPTALLFLNGQTIGSEIEIIDARRGAADRGQHGQATGGRPFIRSCVTRRRDEAPEIRFEHFVVGNTDMVVAIE
jgi:hypothetical protein